MASPRPRSPRQACSAIHRSRRRRASSRSRSVTASAAWWAGGGGLIGSGGRGRRRRTSEASWGGGGVGPAGGGPADGLFGAPLPPGGVLGAGVAAAVAEAIAPRATDNLLVPLAVWLVSGGLESSTPP